jgi:hypothetical protein
MGPGFIAALDEKSRRYFRLYQRSTKAQQR